MWFNEGWGKFVVFLDLCDCFACTTQLAKTSCPVPFCAAVNWHQSPCVLFCPQFFSWLLWQPRWKGCHHRTSNPIERQLSVENQWKHQSDRHLSSACTLRFPSFYSFFNSEKYDFQQLFFFIYCKRRNFVGEKFCTFTYKTSRVELNFVLLDGQEK